MLEILIAIIIIVALATKTETKKEEMPKTKLQDYQRKFYMKLLPLSYEIYKKYNIHPNITLSQASLESGWGSSKIAIFGNNLFGITETDPKKQNPKDAILADSPPKWFKKFKTWTECLEYWSILIIKLYPNAYQYAKIGDVSNYGKALMSGKRKYAEDPLYDKKLYARFTHDNIKLIVDAYLRSVK
jgi:flagellum-specific peptidoglycan hydrolase FlgJ